MLAKTYLAANTVGLTREWKISGVVNGSVVCTTKEELPLTALGIPCLKLEYADHRPLKHTYFIGRTRLQQLMGAPK